jgi:predicted RNA-binding protein with RPS1 domain
LAVLLLRRSGLNKNDVVTVTVLEVRDGGLEVQAGDDGATGFIKRSDLGRDRDEQRPDRFQVGQKFDAMVIGFDRSKKPNFSVKALQMPKKSRRWRSTARRMPARRWATFWVKPSRRVTPRIDCQVIELIGNCTKQGIAGGNTGDFLLQKVRIWRIG